MTGTNLPIELISEIILQAYSPFQLDEAAKISHEWSTAVADIKKNQLQWKYLIKKFFPQNFVALQDDASQKGSIDWHKSFYQLVGINPSKDNQELLQQLKDEYKHCPLFRCTFENPTQKLVNDLIEQGKIQAIAALFARAHESTKESLIKGANNKLKLFRLALKHNLIEIATEILQCTFRWDIEAMLNACIEMDNLDLIKFIFSSEKISPGDILLPQCLQNAAKSGSVHASDFFLDKLSHYSDPKLQETVYSALMAAAENRHLIVVSTLLAKLRERKILLTPTNYYTRLFNTIAKAGFLDIAQQIFSFLPPGPSQSRIVISGTILNGFVSSFRLLRPLYSAIKHGHIKFVEWLLNLDETEHEFNENSDEYAEALVGSLLKQAVQYGRVDIMDLLLHHPRINKWLSLDNVASLADYAECAVVNNQLAALNRILDFAGGKQTQLFFHRREVPLLHVAAQHGHLKIVKRFIDIAGDEAKKLVSAIDASGFTALHHAVCQPDPEVASVILKAAGSDEKALLLAQNNLGETALHLSVGRYSKPGDILTTRLLLTHAHVLNIQPELLEKRTRDNISHAWVEHENVPTVGTKYRRPVKDFEPRERRETQLFPLFPCMDHAGKKLSYRNVTALHLAAQLSCADSVINEISTSSQLKCVHMLVQPHVRTIDNCNDYFSSTSIFLTYLRCLMNEINWEKLTRVGACPRSIVKIKDILNSDAGMGNKFDFIRDIARQAYAENFISRGVSRLFKGRDENVNTIYGILAHLPVSIYAGTGKFHSNSEFSESLEYMINELETLKLKISVQDTNSMKSQTEPSSDVPSLKYKECYSVRK